MLDILCDFLIASKTCSGGSGIQYPQAQSAQSPVKNDISQVKLKSSSIKTAGNNLNQMARPQTGAPGKGGGIGRT